MVDSREDFTPAPPIGRALVVSGGHVWAHSLTITQVSLLRGSRVNLYSVNPEALTRILPRLVRRSWTLAALAAGAAAGGACALAVAAAPAAPMSRAVKRTCMRLMDSSATDRWTWVALIVTRAPCQCGA